MTSELVQILKVDEEKCVNCHACIQACPVTFCNDGSGDAVVVDHNLCIGCGHCIPACTHNARSFIDDFHQFLSDINQKTPTVVIVAPSAASNFEDNYLQLNGWLKSLGVEAIFDVSFGAELTVKSYVEHLERNEGKTIIAQPCPSIVSYIEIYQPELIPHLAPVDSPMLHTMKMIREYYPNYKNHKIGVVSPCNAKKREFAVTGLGDYNIAMASIDAYLTENNIELSKFPKLNYDNPPAERGVMFSSPGGLLATLERWIPDVRHKTRKIEGVNTVYNYLKELPRMIDAGKAPLLVDCLSCENGCNAGPLSLNLEKPIDEIEYSINKRNEEQRKHYIAEGNAEQLDKEEIETLLEKYWKPQLYARKYTNLSGNVQLRIPDKELLRELYAEMHKYEESDLYNCPSCGYGACKEMATAIANGLNLPKNCHFYMAKETEIAHAKILKSQRKLARILDTMIDGFVELNTESKIISSNPAFKHMFGRKDVKGKSLLDFLSEKSIRTVEENLALRAQGKSSTYEIEVERPDGSFIQVIVSGTTLLDENGKMSGSFGIFSDISSLKKTQRDLEELTCTLEEKVDKRTHELKLQKQDIMERNEELRQQQEEILAINELLEEQQQQILDTHIELKQREEVTQQKNLELELRQKEIRKKNEELETKRNEIENINDFLQKQQKELLGRYRELELHKIELEEQRDLAHRQRQAIAKQAKKITSSISYAKRIQRALLDFDVELPEIIQDAFVFYRPKDIVGGDFYWIKEFDSFTFIAAGDCTGHGVPGAFMSMLGISLLNDVSDRCVEDGCSSPAIVLTLMRDRLIASLNQDKSHALAKDGIDLALCVIDNKKRELHFSGALSSAILMRGDEVKTIKGDRCPIGVYAHHHISFTDKVEQLHPGDKIYMFSDGYVDQFDGQGYRKFLKKNFRELLVSIHHEPMKKQRQILKERLKAWQGENEQTDDILVMGLQL